MSAARKNIYLCGMIGSGKTTVGRRIAEDLKWSFQDLDQEMDRFLGYSFHRLVQEKGWVKFREIEYTICKRFAASHGMVIGLGGGTIRYEWNRDVLRGTGMIILLTASLEELARRVRLADRPRVNPGVTLEEDLRRIWEESGDRYHQAADLVIRTDAKPFEDIVGEVKPAVMRYLKSDKNL